MKNTKNTNTVTDLQLAVLNAMRGAQDGLTSTLAGMAGIPTNRARGRLHRLWENGFVDAAFDETGESLWSITAKGRNVLRATKASGRSRKAS